MEIQAEKERIIRIIREMPEKKAQEVINVVDELDEGIGVPERVEIRNKTELMKFLQEGIDASRQNKVLPWQRAMAQLRTKYSL